jgi:CRISPR-associated protein, csm1 family
MRTTLAALLHDIGKFYQRTGISLEKQYYRYTKNNGYYHAGYTAKFIEEYIKLAFDQPFNLINESASHHIDSEGIVKISDIISSGHDRKDASRKDYFSEDTEKQAETNGNYKIKRMNSIFDEIKTEEHQVNNQSFIELNTYDKYKISNKLETTNVAKSEEEYDILFKEFSNRVLNCSLNTKTYIELHHKIYPIIKEYTTTIPANTISDFTTVSLFDHLKLTAAIASCIRQETKEKPFILFDYDVSGIQSFIYQITEGDKSKEKISKSLRTRSFYVNILADFIAYYIINAFDISYENVLYSSSGRGRLLLPNTNKFIEKITTICHKIEEELYNLHKGKLSVIFSYSVVDGNELAKSNLSDLVSMDKKENINNKKQKFIHIIDKTNFDFVEKTHGKLCNMCNIHFSDDVFCSFCNDMIQLNDLIIAKFNQFIVEFNFDMNQKFKEYSLKIGNLGHIIFHTTSTIDKINDNSYYLSINGNNLGETKYYAKSVNANISFTDIANIKKNNLGDDKIAVIKMDVDNLGYIFMQGLKKKNKSKNETDKETISKLLTLSRTLDYFFTKKLVDICGENVYINYAGGDDLVIVCPCWQSLELVSKINESFKRFINNNLSFHISAGIDLFDSVTPIRYAITRAEENLASSKECRGKNCFTVMECTIKNDKLLLILNEIDKYEKAILSKKISRGGIFDIYNAIFESLNDKQTIIRYMKYIPHISYSIERNILDYDFKEELKKTFIHLQINEETLKMYKVVLAYALMNTRKESDNNE